jgi:type-F conjugative transfer system pilin assembly protein TrbC
MEKHMNEIKNVILVFVLMFTVSYGYATAAEDYLSYVKAQAQKVKDIIAPYQAEINVLVKNFSTQKTILKNQPCKTDKDRTSVPITTIPTKTMGAKNTNTMSLPIAIFVSFSMPRESLKSWIAQARTINAPIYIRGLINNSFKETTKAVFELVKEQPGGLLVDPTKFKRYSIAQVPTVVIVKQEIMQEAGKETFVADKNTFDVIYGDVTLDYALTKLQEIAEPHIQQRLKIAVKKLRNNSEPQAVITGRQR